MDILLVYIKLIVSLLLVQGTIAQCPARLPECECAYSDSFLDTLECRGLGQNENVPEFYNPSSDIIQTVQIGWPDDHGTTIRELQANAFNGLKPRTLTLTNLDIDNVVTDTFAGLGDTLESLFLDKNNIRTLPSDVFNTLSNLVYLHIDENALTSIDRDLFQDLRNLQHLHAQMNVIVTLAQGTFDALSALERLYLDNNNLTSMPHHALSNLVNLEILSLNSNELTEIGNETFLQNPNMQIVNLRNNKISAIPGELFLHNRQLEHFDISFNRLLSIPTGLIKSVHVDYLDFGFNQISDLHSSTFTLLRSLEYLYLRNNLLRHIPENSFENLISLIVLDLQSNSLQRLDFGYFQGLISLKELYLQFNEIAYVEYGVFDQLTQVQVINLDGNRISTFPDSPFLSCRQLQGLHLNFNKIQYITKDLFKTQVELNYLYLKQNNIRSIEPGSFDVLQKLLHLDLSENWLTEISPRTFELLYDLQTLMLSRNPLMMLDDVFIGLTSLRVLHLNNSCFHDLPPTLAIDLDSIETVYMRDNDLRTIYRETFSGVSTLSHLNLANCNIELIEENSFNNRLVHIDLTGNPLVCNCSNVWLRSQFRNLHNPSGMVCETPENTRNYYSLCYPQGSCSGPTWDQEGQAFCANSPTSPGNTLPSTDSVFVDATVCDLSKYPGLLDMSTVRPTAPTNILSNFSISRVDENFVFKWEVVDIYSGRISGYHVDLSSPDFGFSPRSYDVDLNNHTIGTSQLTMINYTVCISATFVDGVRYNDLLCDDFSPIDFTTTTIAVTTPEAYPSNFTTVAPVGTLSTKDEEGGISMMLTIIVAAAGGALLLLVIILIVCCTRCKSAKTKEKETMPPPYTSIDVAQFDFVKGREEQLVEQSTMSSTLERQTITQVNGNVIET